MKLRRAAIDDLSFLTDAVLAAETLPDKSCLYEKVFQLSLSDLRKHIGNILKTTGGGFQLSADAFFILEDGKERVATCAAWVESANGVSSNLLMARAWQEEIGETWLQAKQKLQTLGKIHIPRTPGALQLETFYIPEAYRGKGYLQSLIQGAVSEYKGEIPLSRAEIELLSANVRARKAYEREGFSIEQRSKTSHPEFEALTGAEGFIQLVRTC